MLKKIIIICPINTNGGIETHVFNLLNNMSFSEVIILTKYYNVETKLAKYLLEKNIKVKLLAKDSFFKNLNIYMSLGLRFLFKRNLVFYSTELSYQTIFLDFLLRKKGIFNLVGNPKDITQQLLRYTSFIKNNKIIIEGSLDNQKIAQKIKKLNVLPHISNIIAFEKVEKIKSNQIRLGYFGWFHSNKRVYELIILFEELLKTLNNITLTLNGEGPEFEKIQSYINVKKLNKYITIKGKWYTIQELRDRHAQTDICILLSKSEGLPLTLIEACAFNTPFISTNIGYIKNLLSYSKFSLLLNIREEFWLNEIKNYVISYNNNETFSTNELQFNNAYSKEILLNSYSDLFYNHT